MLAEAEAAILRAAVAADREAMARRVAAVREAMARPAWGDDDALSDHVATCIHHWYGGAESILERVARALDGKLPSGDRWHQALLEQLALDLPGTRSAVLRPSTRESLRRVLGFRHFFRHAYDTAWDDQRLALAVADLEAAAALLAEDLDALVGRLGAG